MTAKQLLIPRVKVMLDYPQEVTNPLFKGDIFKKGAKGEGRYYYSTQYRYITPENVDKYPHLFKKLEWWEDRKIEDMPEYVKMIYTKKIHQVNKWTSATQFILASNHIYSIHLILPATKEEYEQYQLTITK